jgi:hypothetical protein
LDEKIQRQFTKLLSNGRLDIFCGIGDIDIQASREALSYDKKSQKQIIEVLTRVSDVMTDDIVNKIKFCQTYLEACKKGVALATQADAPFDKLMWRGKSLVREFDFGSRDGCVVVSGHTNLTKSDALSLSFNSPGLVPIDRAIESTVLYYDPVVSNNKIRLKTALLHDRSKYFIVFNNEQDMFAFQADTQRMDNITTEDLPLPEKEDVTYKSISRSKVQLKIRRGGQEWSGHKSTIVEINEMEHTCWVPLSGGGNEPWANPEDRRAYELLCRFDNSFSVIGVPKSLSRKVKHFTLMPLREYTRAALINVINTEERYNAAFHSRTKLQWISELSNNVDTKKWGHLPIVQEARLWQDTVALQRHTTSIQTLLEWQLKPLTDKQIEAIDKPKKKKYLLLAVLDIIYSYSSAVSKKTYVEEILNLLHRRK